MVVQLQADRAAALMLFAHVPPAAVLDSLHAQKTLLVGTSCAGQILTLFASLCPAEVRLEQAPPLYEQSLRTRVQQFYSYMQLSQYADAAALVAV